MVVLIKKLQDGNEEIFCKRCHRKLINKQARLLGYGKVCYAKSKKFNIYDLIEVTNETI